MLGDASLEVLQKQRVAAELVCCCQVFWWNPECIAGIKKGMASAMRHFEV
jgi:hypothetical protein